MRLFILGGGGHGRVVSEAALLSKKWKSIYLVDPKQDSELSGSGSQEKKIFYEKKDILETDVSFKEDYLFIGIGSSEIRSNLYRKNSELGAKFTNIIHPSAILSKKIKVEEGSFFGPNCVVNTNTNIGICVIVNSAAVVEHDCEIGNFSHIAPKATVAGGVKVGTNTHIGGNSFVNENLIIGENVIIGSGSVVPYNIVERGTYVGNPAKKIK